MTAHSPALDGLRGIAIILVLLHHFTILQPVTPLDAAVAQIPLIGWSGVDLFFVLSGFLITGILIDTRGSERYYGSFYARRTLRIFPLYYLVVFASLVVLPRFPVWYNLLAGEGAPQEQLPYWLYLTNFAVASRDAFRHGVLDVAWSLAIEEQFYLLWPAAVWLCPARFLAPLCATVVLAGPAARVWALSVATNPIDVYVLTPFRADALAMGALIACLLREGRLTDLGRPAIVVAAAALSGVVAVCWMDGESWWWGPAMQRVGYTLLALAGGALLVAAVVQPASAYWPRALSAGWLRAFGKYSYALYLVHLPVMRVVRTFVFGPDQFASLGTAWGGQLVFYAAATAPAFAIAWLSWRVLEAPILRLKERFPY